MASTAVTAAAPAPAPDSTLILFARGVIARLELWPALRVAVEQGWGGPESHQKQRWLASVIVDTFEEQQHHPPLRSPPSDPSCSNSPSSSPCMMTAMSMSTVPDAEYITLMLAQVLEDEFGASFEDGSVEAVAADIVGLWGASEDAVREWERRAEGARGKNVDVKEVVDDEDEWEDEESEEGGDDEAPQLMSAAVDAQRPAKPKPVMDEDGFTLVQKGRR
jgi:pre-rRNA-processing protein TSR2